MWLNHSGETFFNSTTDDSDDNDPGGVLGLREDPLDSTAAKVLLGLVIISGITLGIALALTMLKDDEGFIDEVLEDDTGYVLGIPFFGSSYNTQRIFIFTFKQIIRLFQSYTNHNGNTKI